MWSVADLFVRFDLSFFFFCLLCLGTDLFHRRLTVTRRGWDFVAKIVVPAHRSLDILEISTTTSHGISLILAWE
jgi:hypothetical protein